MGRKTLAQWQTINDEFETSRLSVAEFCRQHDFNLKYFYAIRTKLKRQPPSESRFVKAQPSVERVAASPIEPPIQFQCAAGTLTLPVSASPSWVAEFIRALT